MKKILGIVVLGLLLSVNAFALTKEEAIKKFLSNKKLEPIEGIWLSDGGRIIVNYKKNNSYNTLIVYSSELASGSPHFNANYGSSKSMSGTSSCELPLYYTEWGKKKTKIFYKTCKHSFTIINDNLLKESNSLDPDPSIGFKGETASFQYTRIWPESSKD